MPSQCVYTSHPFHSLPLYSISGLSICGHNCLLTAEWMSASKIVCRVGPAKDDKGEIIVTTKSGGLGTSTVSFKLLRPERIGKAQGSKTNKTNSMAACTVCLQGLIVIILFINHFRVYSYRDATLFDQQLKILLDFVSD